MQSVAHNVPRQFDHRAATAHFMVCLEAYFSDILRGETALGFPDMPLPPDHLDREAVDDCRSIATTVALARHNVYKVSWDAEEYANDVSKAALPNPDAEARLMAKYPPLISRDEMLARVDDNLPLVLEPAIVADVKGRILLWSLLKVLSDSRQAKMLRDTRLIEAQMTVSELEPGAKVTKSWRTAPTFYSPNGNWISGSTLLYPAGYQQGHEASNQNPAPSADVRSSRAAEWMTAFEETGGILDGILAITHPTLHAAAQELMGAIWREHAESRAIMATWPVCFSSLQVIINRATLGHRDRHGEPGWFDLLVTLGTYGKASVLELRGLGISLPYGVGSIVPLASKLLLHGVPKFKVAVEDVTYAQLPGRVEDLGHGEGDQAILKHLGSLDIAAIGEAGGSGTSTLSSHRGDDADMDGEGESEVSDGTADGEDVAMAD
ncbi:hypothetical protein GSI_11218 [Ganoderma sinense ZZ0214-1]|uniref:2OGFeDO JBP1/TET oxygenase domain-containing protein n=1 Tax=Ganoderma sinense ZZ0214-1 TaxID=1077348 RepID=A0A2G8RYU6_9APHY|nr:hypothetical protein GSI_11218 [Ganoderma sinense ZZ0214-1]